MKSCIQVSAFLICIALSSAASAGTRAIIASDNQINLEYISTRVNYSETGNGILGSNTGLLDTETGRVPGYALSASLFWRDGHDYYLKLRINASRGNTHYIGAYMGGTYGSVTGTSSAMIYDNFLRLGTAFDISDHAMAIPYLELGFHEWERGVNYGETYTHDYYGIGLLTQYSPTATLVISLRGLIGRTSDSEIVVSGPLGFSGHLGNSATYKAGLSMDYAFTPELHGNIGISYTSFKYGMSDIYSVLGGTYLVWEPDSSTRYTTLRMGIGYAY